MRKYFGHFFLALKEKVICLDIKIKKILYEFKPLHILCKLDFPIAKQIILIFFIHILRKRFTVLKLSEVISTFRIQIIYNILRKN